METDSSISKISPLGEDSVEQLSHAFDDISSATLATISQLSTRCNDLLDSLRAIHLNTLCSHIEKELSAALRLPSLDELKSSLPDSALCAHAKDCVQSHFVNGALSSPNHNKSEDIYHMLNGSSHIVKDDSPALLVKEEHLNSQSKSTTSRIPMPVFSEIKRPEIAQFLDQSIALLEQVLKPVESQIIEADDNSKIMIDPTKTDQVCNLSESVAPVNASADAVGSSASAAPQNALSREHRKDKHKHKHKHKHRRANDEHSEQVDVRTHRKHKHKPRDASGQECSQHQTLTSKLESAHKHKHKRKRRRERTPEGSASATAVPHSADAGFGELTQDAPTGGLPADSACDPHSSNALQVEGAPLNAQAAEDCTARLPNAVDIAGPKVKKSKLKKKSKSKRTTGGATNTSTAQDSAALPVFSPVANTRKSSKASKSKSQKSSSSGCASSSDHVFVDGADGAISADGKLLESASGSGSSTSRKLVLKLKLSRLSVSDAAALDPLAAEAEPSATAIATSEAGAMSAPPFVKPSAPFSSSANAKKHTRWSLPPPLLPSDKPRVAEEVLEDDDCQCTSPLSSGTPRRGRPKRLRMPSTQHKASEYELQPLVVTRPRRAPLSVPPGASSAGGGAKSSSSSASCSSSGLLCSSASASFLESAAAIDDRLTSETSVTASSCISKSPSNRKTRERYFSSNNSARAHVREADECPLPAKKARTLSFGAAEAADSVAAAVAGAIASGSGGRAFAASSSSAGFVQSGECDLSAAGEQLGDCEATVKQFPASASAQAKKDPIPTPGYSQLVLSTAGSVCATMCNVL